MHFKFDTPCIPHVSLLHSFFHIYLLFRFYSVLRLPVPSRRSDMIFFTPLNHESFGLSLFYLSGGNQSSICFGILSSDILWMCPYQRSCACFSSSLFLTRGVRFPGVCPVAKFNSHKGQPS